MKNLSDLFFAIYENSDNSQGALLRAKHEGQWVYSCLHLWPKRGDITLTQALDEIRKQNIKSSVTNIAYDRLLNSLSAQIFTSKTRQFLPSHLQITQTDISKLSQINELGFKVLKIKISKDQDYWQVVEAHQQTPYFRWRLDFNLSSSPKNLEKLLKNTSEDFLDSVDFMEDPFADVSQWENISQTFKIRLAADFAKQDFTDASKLNGADLLILKPSREKIVDWIEFAHQNMKRVVFTNYLQHPLGQIFDFAEALHWHTRHPLLFEDCGFATFSQLESMPFERQNNSLAILPPFNFEKLLETLSWQKL